MDLTPDAVILRPFWFTPDRHILRIAEAVTAAYILPRDPGTDHRIRNVGNYREGKPLGYAGHGRCLRDRARQAGVRGA